MKKEGKKEGKKHSRKKRKRKKSFKDRELPRGNEKKWGNNQV